METNTSNTFIPLPEGSRNGIEHICAEVLSKGYGQCHWMVICMYFPTSPTAGSWPDAVAWFKARGVRAEFESGSSETVNLRRL